ncbi:DUF973 family protein [Sulfurisphaera ohwakuensis]|uniref:DUF973 family protein n=1 Tax=Sulfurisphaera ohwakuensis TaxID=69656 RepID=UPI0036F39922
MLLRRKAKKGLSGAVTALILVIASVIIALVVVGFAFGLFGAFGGTPTVTQVGTGTISSSSGVATITLKSTGNVNIVGASIAGLQGASVATTISLNAGFNTVTISFGSGYNLQPGSTYTITLSLSDGQTVQVSVIAQ